MKKNSLVLALFVLAHSAIHGAEVNQWEVFETSFTSTKRYANPFTDLDVSVVFQHEDQQWTVPAFWRGGEKWSVRFAPPVLGEYQYRIEATDKSNPDLNRGGQSLRAIPYQGKNPLLKHGFVGVSGDRRHFEHADGTPFFWLGDTWWKGLCKRLTWEGFQELTADRKTKGFSVVQMVCGPYPDEGWFDPRLENEGGMPYTTKEYTLVNPAYFDYADRRFQHMIESGIAPAIVGCWGRSDCNSLEAIGVEGVKRHWRYLVARYSAYPVFWILAGEIPVESKWGQSPWGDVAKYLRQIDPYHHPVTCHTGQGRRGAAGDEMVIDFDMMGGNHDEKVAISAATLSILTSARDVTPPMPVLVGETCYEGPHATGVRRCPAAHLLDKYAEQSGRPYLWRGRNLALWGGRKSGSFRSIRRASI